MIPELDSKIRTTSLLNELPTLRTRSPGCIIDFISKPIKHGFLVYLQKKQTMNEQTITINTIKMFFTVHLLISILQTHQANKSQSLNLNRRVDPSTNVAFMITLLG